MEAAGVEATNGESACTRNPKAHTGLVLFSPRGLSLRMRGEPFDSEGIHHRTELRLPCLPLGFISLLQPEFQPIRGSAALSLESSDS
jgi:hypothetical protein